MQKKVMKKWVAAIAVVCMLITSIFDVTGKGTVTQANSGVNLLTGLATASITSARAWIDATGKITSVSTFTNTDFENTKSKSIDGNTGTHTDIPGGWGASSGGYQTLGMKYDLGSTKSISELKVYGIASSAYYISGVRIFVSETGNDWVGKTAVLVDETNDNIGKVEFGGPLQQTVNARYIMIIVTNYISTAGQPRIAEVQAYSTTNIARNLTASQITPARAWINSSGQIYSNGTYSNTAFENTKMKTIDGDKGTHMDIPGGWGASSGGYQTLGVQYDLGAVKNITAINVSGIAASTYYISGVRVFVSQTGTDWVGKTAVVVDETNDNIGKVEFGGALSQAVNARYVMVIVTNYISTAGQPRIAEVDITGSSSTGGTTTTYNVANIINNLKLNGRTTSLSGNIANGLDLDWSTSGVSFNMTAAATTDVTFNFSMYSRSTVDPSVYFTVYMDGVELTNQRYGMKASAANVRENLNFKIAGVTAGNHLIEIYKQTENKSGECTLLSIAMNGTFGSKPASKTLKMEVIGDSVTAGYGNLGTKAITTDSVGSSPLYQDAMKTFGALTAKRFNAEISIVGMSGIAVACGSADTAHYYIMPDYYTFSNAARYSSKYYSGSWINWNFGTGSDIVVINLGSNDWNRHKTVVNGQEVWNDSSACGVTYTEVGEYMIAFLRTVRANNPNARIVWTYGMTGYASRDKVQMAVNTLAAEGDTKVSYLDLLTGNDGVDGANGHPSVAEHTTASNTLFTYLDNFY